MGQELRNLLHYVCRCAMIQAMAKPAKQPNRPHFIEQWAVRRAVSMAELARAIGADKSLVTRWYKGSSPTRPYQVKLAEFFGCSIEALFRDPDEDWIQGVLAGRTQGERARIRTMLEAAFPIKQQR
jgi:transcriptional regulator with XRE-family HTH domain